MDTTNLKVGDWVKKQFKKGANEYGQVQSEPFKSMHGALIYAATWVTLHGYQTEGFIACSKNAGYLRVTEEEHSQLVLARLEGKFTL